MTRKELGFRPVEENLRQLLRHLAQIHSGHVVRELPGVSLASAGIEFQMFNAAFLSTPVGSPRELRMRLEQAAGFFEEQQLRWSWWSCEDWLRGCDPRHGRDVVRRCGLIESTRMPGMVADELWPARRRMPALRFRPIGDAATIEEFCHLTAIAFRMPLRWCEEVYGSPEVWRAPLQGYVGYWGVQAVVASCIMHAANALGLYCVATLPEHERQGFGEAATRHAITEGRSKFGNLPLVLQATHAGAPLYRNMGFEPVTYITIYTSP
jgi:GNAT superfamily N-acetyltransferase